MPKVAYSQQDRDKIRQSLIVAGLVVCTAYLVDGTYNPFLYFRF